MSFTFLRKYQIAIENEVVDYNDFSFPRQTNPRTLLATLDRNQIQGKFKFSSSTSAASADANTLRIFNAEEDVNKALRQTGVKVTIRAGYENDVDGSRPENNDLPIIYKGEVSQVKIYRNNTDTITEVTLSSALTAKRVASVSESFDKNTKISTMLEKVSSSLGLTTTIELGSNGDLTLTSPRGYNGNTVQVLEREVNRLGLVWFIQNERIYIASKDQLAKLVKEGTVYKIEAGRIKGNINWSTEVTTTSVTKDPKVKADFTVFLTPTLLIGDKVEVQLGDSTTTLVIDAIEHTLDYYGDSWDTKVTAQSEAGV